MDTAYDGRQIVGMDLHRRRSVLVRMTEEAGGSGWPGSPTARRSYRRTSPGRTSPRVVLEATFGWYWAADTLTAAGAEVHLAHPLGVKAFSYRRVKNDERDAADLADLLRMGRLPEAWIAPAGVRELRELTVTGISSCTCDQLQRPGARCAGQARRPGDLLRYLRDRRVRVAGSAGPAAALCRKVTSLRHLTGELTGEITMLSEVIADLLAHHRGYRVIQQLPGIGPVLAAVIIAEIGDVHPVQVPRPAVLVGRADAPAP